MKSSCSLLGWLLSLSFVWSSGSCSHAPAVLPAYYILLLPLLRGVSSFSTTTSTTTVSSTQLWPSSASPVDPSSLLYEEHEKALVRRGELEGTFMASTATPIAANIVKGSGGGGGFGGGGGGGSKKALLKDQAKAHAKVLKRDGVVRIDNVLSADLADALRGHIYELREESEALVASGQVPSLARFADVLLTKQRRDMTLPIDFSSSHNHHHHHPWTLDALQSLLLESPVGGTFQQMLSKDSILREWSCLMSDPGSQRQVVHPDTPWQPDPVLFTCFIALQDVTIDMGPTTWIPGTHTQAAHATFQDETTGSSSSSSSGDGDDSTSRKSPKDFLLSTTPSVLGTLSKGSCAIFDSRLLHCGGANMSSNKTSRALLYCSFQNPTVANPGNPGSIRKDLIGQWTLQTLQDELSLRVAALRPQKGTPKKKKK